MQKYRWCYTVYTKELNKWKWRQSYAKGGSNENSPYKSREGDRERERGEDGVSGGFGVAFWNCICSFRSQCAHLKNHSKSSVASVKRNIQFAWKFVVFCECVFSCSFICVSTAQFYENTRIAPVLYESKRGSNNGSSHCLIPSVRISRMCANERKRSILRVFQWLFFFAPRAFVTRVPELADDIGWRTVNFFVVQQQNATVAAKCEKPNTHNQNLSCQLCAELDF